MQFVKFIKVTFTYHMYFFLCPPSLQNQDSDLKKTSRQAFLVVPLSLNISRVLSHNTGLAITKEIKTSLSISSTILQQKYKTQRTNTNKQLDWSACAGILDGRQKSVCVKACIRSRTPLSPWNGPAPEHLLWQWPAANRRRVCSVPLLASVQGAISFFTPLKENGRPTFYRPSKTGVCASGLRPGTHLAFFSDP